MTPESTTIRDGTLAQAPDGRTVLRFERHLAHPIDHVWAALTQPGELIGWLADADLDLNEGGPVVLRWQNTDEDGNHAVLHGTITELDPPHLIAYDSDIHGLLRWELHEEAGGCVLTLTNTTPAPDEFRAKVLAGWHIHLDLLVDVLDGHLTDWPAWAPDTRAVSTGASWADHHARYAARPEAR